MPTPNASWTHQAGGEGRDPEQRGAQQRRDPRVLAARLHQAEQAQPHDPRAQQGPAPGGPAQAAPLQQGVGDRDQGAGEQHRPGEVDPAGRSFPVFRHQPGRTRQRRQRDRDVDEEHRAPAPAEQVGTGQHPAQEQAHGRGEAEHGPVDPERLAPLPAAEHGPEGGQQLRGHHRRRGPLNHPGGDQLARGLRQARTQAGQPEHRDPGQEQPLAPEQVTQAARGDQDRGEGQHVGRHHPFELGGARAEIVPDRGQGHVDDRHVDHVHQHRGRHRRRRKPAARVAPGGNRALNLGRRSRAHCHSSSSLG